MSCTYIYNCMQMMKNENIKYVQYKHIFLHERKHTNKMLPSSLLQPCLSLSKRQEHLQNWVSTSSFLWKLWFSEPTEKAEAIHPNFTLRWLVDQSPTSLNFGWFFLGLDFLWHDFWWEILGSFRKLCLMLSIYQKRFLPLPPEFLDVPP